MATVIFDFDGTIADTFPAIITVSYELAGRKNQLSKAQLDELRRLPLLTAPRKLGIAWYYFPKLAFCTRPRLSKHIKDAVPFDGVASMLETLHKAGHQLYILSSNYSENVRLFLTHHKLDVYFKGIEFVYYANALTKTLALRRLIAKHSLSLSDCYHVGNETLDVQAAQRVGMRSVAVAWGGYDLQALKDTHPSIIIDKPADLPKFLAADVA